MTVFLADDQPEVRAAIRLLLDEQDGLSLAGEAASAAELDDRLPGSSADLLLVDWDLPGLDRERLLSAAAAGQIGRIVALTTHTPLDGVPFVSKSQPPYCLLRTILGESSTLRS
jgi:DNA-binding NarL/FixJ family response regulator